jgi:hypothetical protein
MEKQVLDLFIEKKVVKKSDLMKICKTEHKLFVMMSMFMSTFLYNKSYTYDNKDTLRKGMKVEFEHISLKTPYSKYITAIISCDHLKESDKYYELLEEMEKKF